MISSTRTGPPPKARKSHYHFGLDTVARVDFDSPQEYVESTQRHLTSRVKARARLALGGRAANAYAGELLAERVGFWVSRLDASRARITTTAKGTPRENAQAESFFRPLKNEEVYLRDYRHHQEAERSIGRFIEAVHNEKQLPLSLGYRPPSKFEALLTAGLLSGCVSYRKGSPTFGASDR
jgi:putative transposase